MNAAENKKLMQDIYSEMAQGNYKPRADRFADDIAWTITGSTSWSKTYRGKDAVANELLGPLREQFADRYTSTATRFIADGDLVVVEARGRVTTKSGKPYNNSYCFIYRLEEGMIKEITEYMDTELVTSALSGPQVRLFNPEGIAKPTGYSHVAKIRGGKLVQIAGQVALDSSGALVGADDFAAQVQQTFQNLKTAVEAAGGTFADVVKLNYYCVERVSADLFPAMREIRDRFVNVENPPVSTFVYVSRLVRPEWLIEIEASAVLPL